MSLPENAAFETFLRECSVVATKPANLFLPLSEAHAAGRVVSECPPLFIKHPSSDLKISSVLRQIVRTLSSCGSPATEQVAIAALALIVESRPEGVSAVEHSNACLERLIEARLMQSVVLQTPLRSGYRLDLGTYSLAAFDPTKILYSARRGGSSFPIDLREIAGCPALERAPIDVSLVDWGPACSGGAILRKWGTEIVDKSFKDSYFAAVSDFFTLQIKATIKQDILVYESAGMIFIDVDSLIHAPLTKVISLFDWKTAAGHKSWALFTNVSNFHVNLQPDDEFRASKQWLEKALGYTTLNPEKPFDRAIETYCRFLQRANEQRREGRRDEAFLHFAIALDLLLGAEGKSAESVAQRAALIVHRDIGKSPEDAVNLLKGLYSVRSKYVHEGRATSPNDTLLIEAICSAVLWSLLACSSKETFVTIDDWVLKVDYAFAAERAKTPLSESDLLALGIPAAGERRQPPNRIGDIAATSENW